MNADLKDRLPIIRAQAEKAKRVGWHFCFLSPDELLALLKLLDKRNLKTGKKA